MYQDKPAQESKEKKDKLALGQTISFEKPNSGPFDARPYWRWRRLFTCLLVSKHNAVISS
jgi:hypothetical protein